jgi:hypothetical protein
MTAPEVVVVKLSMSSPKPPPEPWNHPTVAAPRASMRPAHRSVTPKAMAYGR